MTLIDETTHIFFPVVASMYFDVFDGLIQAYIFVFLTGMFIQEQVED
jgi:F-type H+-transporting ATPase subunit a